MFTAISNMPISGRLKFAFLLAALIPCLLIGILIPVSLGVEHAHSQAIQANLDALRITRTALSSLQNMSANLESAYKSQYHQTATPQHVQTGPLIQQVQNYANQFDTEARQYQQDYQLLGTPRMSDALNMLQSIDPGTSLPTMQQNSISQVVVALWPDYKKVQDQLLKNIGSRTSQSQATALMDEARSKYFAVTKEWNHLIQITQDIAGKIAQVGPAQITPIAVTAGIALLLILLVIIGIGYVTHRTIIHPLKQLATLTERISRGETSARVAIAGKDEIHLIATSMNVMLDNIVHLIQEVQSQHDTLQAQVEKLVSEVSGVGEGDLRVQAEVTTDALGVLADSFNYMVEELAGLVVRVKEVANEVEGSTTSILDRMTQLVEAEDAQIKRIAQAVSEVERMTASSRQVAERAQALYEIERTARQDAQAGRSSLSQAIEGIGRISENVQATAGKVQMLGDRSREINEIVEVISSIAHQTNRLALDAAIQAAMAGENGKGFGAVAADIRRLAERAKDQAGMIARIVRDVREDINAVAVSMQETEQETSTGAHLTEEAGLALRSIFSAVENQAHEIESINNMAMQQLQSSSAVLQIMHSVSETTQQSSISTREASQNMERLARLVEQLRASVEAFKLRENQSYHLAGDPLNEQTTGTLSPTSNFRTVSATIEAVQPGSRSNRTHYPFSSQVTDDPYSLQPSPQPYQPYQPYQPQPAAPPHGYHI
ncbi:MAG: HAMP domain-containing protein [Ktedonobacteraceae bacterium]|nr:HAMP domain-containing protein [Ktedonobacteraceae bacterium]